MTEDEKAALIDRVDEAELRFVAIPESLVGLEEAIEEYRAAWAAVMAEAEPNYIRMIWRRDAQ